MSTPTQASMEGGAMQQTPAAAADEDDMDQIPQRSMRGKHQDIL